MQVGEALKLGLPNAVELDRKRDIWSPNSRLKARTVSTLVRGYYVNTGELIKKQAIYVPAHHRRVSIPIDRRESPKAVHQKLALPRIFKEDLIESIDEGLKLENLFSPSQKEFYKENSNLVNALVDHLMDTELAWLTKKSDEELRAKLRKWLQVFVVELAIAIEP